MSEVLRTLAEIPDAQLEISSPKTRPRAFVAEQVLTLRPGIEETSGAVRLDPIRFKLSTPRAMLVRGADCH